MAPLDSKILQTFILGTLFLSLSCQQAPTRVSSTHSDLNHSIRINSNLPVDQKAIPKEVVIIDVRDRLKHSLAHLEASVPIDPEEFFVTKGKFKNYPKSDRSAMARRLAQIGIDPTTTVLIIGEGAKGNGSEGQLAWLIQSLGVKDVQITAFDGIHNRRVINGDPVLDFTSKPIWNPEATEFPIASIKEVKDFASGKLLREGKRVHLIDVRSENEFFGKLGFGEGYKTPNLNSVNIPWTEFLTNEGRVSAEMRERLVGIDIRPDDRVIVISNRGRRSAFAAFALTQLGYKNVANAAGGFEELLR